jgi:hypothetical protein
VLQGITQSFPTYFSNAARITRAAFIFLGDDCYDRNFEAWNHTESDGSPGELVEGHESGCTHFRGC